MKTIYSGRIVFENRVSPGYLQTENGKIIDILENYKGKVDYDFGDSYLLPGLINIHSEYIARETVLPINQLFPFSKIFYDVEMKFLLSGVTTLFHSVELVQGRHKRDFTSGPQLLRQIRELSGGNTLIEHRTNLEFPLNFMENMDTIKELIEDDIVDHISYLGYFRSEKERYREVYYQEYVQRVMELDEETVMKMVERVRELRTEANLEELAYIIKYAHSKGIKVGSNEISSSQKLDFLRDFGINIIEFPSSIEAMDYAHRYGKKVLCDSLGLFKKNKDSQSFDLLEAIMQGKVDLLSSDTRSGDMLSALFYIGEFVGLPKAVALSSANPAEVLGLHDRGKIEKGRKADFAVVKEIYPKNPLVQAMFCDGELKYQMHI